MTWKTISYSKLHLLACPYAAFLKYEASIKSPTTPWMARGNAIHFALEKAHEPFDLTAAISHFKSEFARIIDKDEVAIDWVKTKKMEAESILMLERYNEQVQAGIIAPTALALEAEFSIPFSGTKVVGKIDKVEKDEGGYTITDYKTGKTKPDPWFLGHNLQLTAYAWACQELYGELPTRLVWHHLATGDLFETTRTQRDIDDLKITIQNALTMHEQGMRHRIFHEKVCGECDFQGAMCDDRDLEEEAVATVTAGGRMEPQMYTRKRAW